MTSRMIAAYPILCRLFSILVTFFLKRSYGASRSVTDSGLAAAIALALKLRGAQPVEWDAETVTGALALHVSQPTDNFQPMNANYGILRPLAEHIRDKALKKRRLAERALERIDRIAGYLRGQL